MTQSRGDGRRLGAVASALAVLALVVTLPVPAARAQVSSPASITLGPDCGPPRPSGGAAGSYSVAVAGVQFNPFTAVLVTFDADSGGRPESLSATTDGFGQFALTLQVAARGPGRYTVRADDFKQREAVSAFSVPCRPPPIPPEPPEPPVPGAPTLSVSPALGAAGSVTSATGQGFPSGAKVKLEWVLVGANPPVPRPASSTVVTVDRRGRFRTSVLILPHEQVGARQLVATAAGTGKPFEAAPAPFRVVAGESQPSQFRYRR